MWIETSREGRVSRIVLNRPDKRNALNLALCRELIAAFDEAGEDPHTGAILLSGNGPAFCAGMDLREAASTGSDELSQIGHVHEQLFTIYARARKPIVAAVRGAALAGGTGLVANAHICVAAEDATFGLTEIRVGLWPFLIFRCVALAIGERRAIELSLTGRIFGAQEALGLGLVQRVEKADDVDVHAATIARELSQASAAALGSGLEYVNQIRGKSWTEAGEIGRSIRNEMLKTGDFAEGVNAFLNRRAPIWPSIPK